MGAGEVLPYIADQLSIAFARLSFVSLVSDAALVLTCVSFRRKLLVQLFGYHGFCKDLVVCRDEGVVFKEPDGHHHIESTRRRIEARTRLLIGADRFLATR
jgi:hypothetical protein